MQASIRERKEIGSVQNEVLVLFHQVVLQEFYFKLNGINYDKLSWVEVSHFFAIKGLTTFTLRNTILSHFPMIK